MIVCVCVLCKDDYCVCCITVYNTAAPVQKRHSLEVQRGKQREGGV